MSLPIDEVIAELGNSERPLPNSRLVTLSNLNLEELDTWEQTWTTIQPERRRQIVQRLVELAEDNVELNFDSIFKKCLRDTDIGVRSKAIEGLWENEEPSLIDPLIGLLEQDASEKVKIAAATALGKFVMLAEHKKLRSCHASRLSRALLGIINDKSQPIEVRCQALEAAAPLSLPEVQKAIMEVYQNNYPRLKASVIYSMGRSCDYRWLPMLLKELGSADAEIRYEAAGACGELGEKEATPYLMELIRDPDVDVQMAAIQALGKIGGTGVKECLEQCLNDPREAIKQAAEQALHELEVYDYWQQNQAP